MKKLNSCRVFCCVVLIPIFSISNLIAQKPHQASAAEIKIALNKLNVLGNALYFAAHPDDENTRLIAYLSKEKLMNTAYMSLTRGDGGQNLVGPEIREQLGIIRTQELLQARRVDGSSQFFSRANDFGYSKSFEETLKVWGKQEVLADAVWVIRKFKPDVIITRFPPDERAGHGHHTTSAMIAIEAFDLAGDPTIFPEQLDKVDTWQPTSLYINTGRWWNKNISDESDSIFSIDVGKYNPLLGRSYTEIAASSRSMHKSQGFGAIGLRGENKEYLEYVKGALPKENIFEAVDMSWKRVDDGLRFQLNIQEIINNFDPENPSNSVPSLVKLYDDLSDLEDEFWKETKKAEVKQLIKDCLGLYIEIKSENYYATVGENVKLNIEIVNRSSSMVDLINFEIVDADVVFVVNKALEPNIKFEQEFEFKIPENTPLSTPYWLKEKGKMGLFKVNAQHLIGQPENKPAFSYKVKINVKGETIDFELPIIFKTNDPVKGESYRPFVIVPHATVNTNEEILIFTDKSSKSISYSVKIFADSLGKGEITLDVPTGWIITPSSYDVDLQSKGEEMHFDFEIKAPDNQGIAFLKPRLKIGNSTYRQGAKFIKYDHIPTQLYLRDTETKLVNMDVEIAGNKIGYIPGAGDEVAHNLRIIGYDVDVLVDNDINEMNLKQYDAVILGVRAFNTVDRMNYYKDILFSYVKNGGNMIVQYNTAHRLVTKEFSPFEITLSRNRVTEENAKVSFLAPNHEVLNKPNKITPADFDLWVQERGLYFPEKWDKAFTPILSWKDSGDEKDFEGSLLVSKYGEGHYIYTGISFFRQLPAGVPGAYRLFVNLISVGNNSTNIVKQ